MKTPRLAIAVAAAGFLLGTCFLFLALTGDSWSWTSLGRASNSSDEESKRSFAGTESGTLEADHFQSSPTAKAIPELPARQKKRERAREKGDDATQGLASGANDALVEVAQSDPEELAPVASVHEPMRKRANNVERFATLQVDRLSKRLKLSSDQEERIFEIYVKASQAYDPIMQIVSRTSADGGASIGDPAVDHDAAQGGEEMIGSSLDDPASLIDEVIQAGIPALERPTELEEDPLAPTLEEAVADVLDDTQVVIYDQLLARNHAWWNDLIDDVLLLEISQPNTSNP